MKHNFPPQQENLLESFLSNYNISFNQEMIEKLYLYADLVLEWNSKTNLISKNDAPKFISRHITDSLIPYIMLIKESKLKNNSTLCLKAVVTATNYNWTFEKLVLHLLEEYQKNK